LIDPAAASLIISWLTNSWIGWNARLGWRVFFGWWGIGPTIRTRSQEDTMNQLHARRPSAAPVVLTIPVEPTINRERTNATPDVSPSGKPTGRIGQLLAFDRLIWGTGQEPVIEG
jgi:hypothetical protein